MSFKTEDHMNVVYGILELAKLTWCGDSPADMCNYLFIWDRVKECIPYPVDVRCERDMFAAQFEKTKVLELDWKAYDQLTPSDPKKTI